MASRTWRAMAAILVAGCATDTPPGGNSRDASLGAGAPNAGASGTGGAGDHGGAGGDHSSGGAAGAPAAGGAAGGSAGGAGRSVRGAPDASVTDAGKAKDAAGEGRAPDGARAHHPKRLFITHDRWPGDLSLAANTAGLNVTTGIAGGDALCNASASKAGLGGTWVAWLSDESHDALDRVADVGPWYRVDGAEVFHDKAALVGNPLVAIDLDETGALTEKDDASGLADIPWTGTLADGTRATSSCHDWTSSANDAYGMAGANTATTQAKWSEATVPLCNNPYHIYCFEQ